MPNILAKIVETKRKEMATLKAHTPIGVLQKQCREVNIVRRDFGALFAERKTVLIAEIKPKSPSAGELIAHSPLDSARGGPLDIADMYAKSDADALSVLTDLEYFGGSLQLLTEVRAKVPQPILRKDFIIDEYQVYESYLCGADAFLLIANILTVGALRELRQLGESLGMSALVEVHDEAEMRLAIASGAKIIGINNRNLDTLEIDVATTERLAPLVPEGLPFVSESGLASPADVSRVRAAGARGILVGTSILKAADPIDTIHSFKTALVR